jgi:hypothetical protein
VIPKSRAVDMARKVTWLSSRSQYGSVRSTLRHFRHTWRLIDSCRIVRPQGYSTVNRHLIQFNEWQKHVSICWMLYKTERQFVPLFARRQRRHESLMELAALPGPCLSEEYLLLLADQEILCCHGTRSFIVVLIKTHCFILFCASSIKIHNL